MEMKELAEKIGAAGVVGAGGAGFPTHKKLAPGIDTVLINAAECEPLLYTDYAILKQHMDMVLSGAQSMAEAMGAKQVVLCIKHHTALRLALEADQPLGGICRTGVLPDVYPMGDEIIMIYQALGRVVPPGQLPSSAGVVVINAETAYNVCNALQGIPVTKKWLTIGGSVEHPLVIRVPVGTNVGALLRKAGVTVPEGYVVLDGGPAMGAIVSPATAIVTKKTKSLLILPETIPAVQAKRANVQRLLKRTSSACCQCMMCTEMCPRHLLGYPLQPHRTLRAAGSGNISHPEDLLSASVCSGCSVCTLMACTQGITPSVVMTEVKMNLGKNRLGYRGTEPTRPAAERDFRLVPSDRFMARIGVARYDRMAEWAGDWETDQPFYTLPLSMHVGKPSVPVVQEGDMVTAGQMLAKAEDGISAALHASIDGRVAKVTSREIEIQREVK
ncbi:MAG: hypothetical protein HFG18_06980 [Oscillospiraceae bacterium]|nr:hypothetical protein [Oscillospiraceae bacterium]MCI9363406.1 hypothetical protein [Oscillospiraceae bacterium]MCI9669430.1 hypothetical protein [Oscillospiraceae bacterium]